MALKDRLARLEAMITPPPPVRFEVWVPTENGRYRCVQTGDTLTEAQLEELHPLPFTIAIDRASLPDVPGVEDA